jgi:hypothetical protein
VNILGRRCVKFVYCWRPLPGCGGSAGDGASAPRLLASVTLAVPSNVQKPVDLRSAGTFALLSKTGITNVYASVINGDVGTSPITGAAIDLTCGEIATGKLYTVDAAGPEDDGCRKDWCIGDWTIAGAGGCDASKNTIT